jgi:hypothetical protein
MDLKDLALGEKVALCRHVEHAVAKRLKLWSRWVDPQDASLRQLFMDLAEDAVARLADIDRLSEWVGAPPVVRLSDGLMDELVIQHLPTLTRSTGEGLIQRESGTYMAQSLQEESTRLYRALADGATDGESRIFFLHWSREGEWDTEFIRSVIMA